MKNKELTRKFIILAVAVLVFVAAVLVSLNIIHSVQKVGIEDAAISITDITVRNEDVLIEWQCDNTMVTSYQVQRQDSPDSTFKIREILGYSQKYWSDNSIKQDNVYGYRIIAVNSTSTEECNKATSDAVYICTSEDKNITAPEEFVPHLTMVNDGNRYLKWEIPYNSAMTSIAVYRRESGSDWEVDYILSPFSKELHEIDESAEYRIRVRFIVDGKRVNSEYSNTVTVSEED